MRAPWPCRCCGPPSPAATPRWSGEPRPAWKRSTGLRILQRLAAALRLLALRKPAGADQALLEYVAWAEEDGPSDDVLAALLAVGLKDAAPTPAVRTALADRSAACRAGAAYVVGKAASEHRKALAALLTDSSDFVRFHAAAALLVGGDRQAVPVLIDAAGDGSLSLALRAQELLLIAAGDSAPSVSLGSDAEARRTCSASLAEVVGRQGRQTRSDPGALRERAAGLDGNLRMGEARRWTGPRTSLWQGRQATLARGWRRFAP